MALRMGEIAMLLLFFVENKRENQADHYKSLAPDRPEYRIDEKSINQWHPPLAKQTIHIYLKVLTIYYKL